MTEEKNYKNKQQDLTELNGDGNRERGREGEDLVKPLTGEDVPLTDEEKLKKKIEELRKRDPFIYR
jgi:hypothetical protein